MAIHAATSKGTPFPLKPVLTWGLVIGLANLLWLYLSYYLGLHTSGIVVFQLVPLGWLFITLAGYLLALRAVRRCHALPSYWAGVNTPGGLVYQVQTPKQPKFSYWAGLRAGVLIASVTAIIAVPMQVGYYKLIHPAWPEYMTQQTREYFSAQGLPPAHIEAHVVQARQTFSLRSYATQSALTALLTGIVLSAILMIFLRHKDGKITEEKT